MGKKASFPFILHAGGGAGRGALHAPIKARQHGRRQDGEKEGAAAVGEAASAASNAQCLLLVATHCYVAMVCQLEHV